MSDENILTYSFIQEAQPDDELKKVLKDDEVVLAAYKTIRDRALITNKRFIISDKQGLTGKKTEIYTIPLKSVIMYSTENDGFMDLNSEIKLWTLAGVIKIKLLKGLDVRKIDKILNQHILI